MSTALPCSTSLDKMVRGKSITEPFRNRLDRATPVPRSAPLRVTFPPELRRITLPDLPRNVEISEGVIRITGADAEQVVEGRLLVAQVLHSDLDSVRQRLEPPTP